MSPERVRQLEKDPAAVLTKEEVAAGWCWCVEFDFMLVGPDSPEAKLCACAGDCRARTALARLDRAAEVKQ